VKKESGLIAMTPDGYISLGDRTQSLHGVQ